MTRTLALDTTSHFGSIALLEGPDVIEEVLLHAPDGFGSILFGRIASLLDRQRWNIGDVDCFASASGPGSFTGVRLGLTAVKGLAEATAAPAFGVSNLQALADFAAGPLRAAVLDARRGEVYGALYNEQLTVIQEERVLPFREWIAGLPSGISLVSTDFSPFRAALAGTALEHAAIIEQRALASSIGRIAAQKYAAGERPDPAGLDANYVRRSDAELLFKAPY